MRPSHCLMREGPLHLRVAVLLAIIVNPLLRLEMVAQFISQAPSKCQSSTVDETYGPDFARAAKVLLVSLKAAVVENNKAEIASLMSYPVRVNRGNSVRKIRSRDQLVRNFDLVFTSEVKQEVMRQSANCLFANGQGVMIGNGQVWFTQVNGKMKIIALNITPARRNH
jgi:hypothetical protein